MATFLTAKFAQVDTSINDTQAQITALPTCVEWTPRIPPAIALNRTSL